MSPHKCALRQHEGRRDSAHFSSWRNFNTIFSSWRNFRCQVVVLRPSWVVCAASSDQAAQTHHPVKRSDLSTRMDPRLPPISHPISEARQSASPRHYLPLASHRHRQWLPFHQRVQLRHWATIAALCQAIASHMGIKGHQWPFRP